MKEQPFILHKSTVSIFRFEDVILNLYPTLGSLKRKGMTTKEIFMKNDPTKPIQGGFGGLQGLAEGLGSGKDTYGTMGLDNLKVGSNKSGNDSRRNQVKSNQSG